MDLENADQLETKYRTTCTDRWYLFVLMTLLHSFNPLVWNNNRLVGFSNLLLLNSGAFLEFGQNRVPSAPSFDYPRYMVDVDDDSNLFISKSVSSM